MDNFKPQHMEIDLEKVIAEKDVGLIMGSGDEDANMFIVSVKRGGETVNLAGLGVVGYLIMPNDETLRIPGSVVDNEACVTIKKAGYVYDGAFQLAIKLVVNGKENTIAIFYGKNARTQTENISDGERVIYGVKDILNMIDSMDQAEKDAKAAATSANNAAASANSAASKANTATSNANAATTAANNAAQTATTAAGNADNATSAANTAAQTANDAAGRAEAVASKLPYIGDNGNWYVFDVTAGEYVDSGFPSRGIPGQGAVSTVNSKQPDTSGNVQLSAGDVGARPDNWIPTSSDVGALAADGKAADASKLGGKNPVQYCGVPNYTERDKLFEIVSAPAQNSIFNFVCEENGWLGAMVNTQAATTSPYIYITINNQYVFYYSQETQKTHQVRTSPMLPVSAGDSVSVELGSYDVAGTTRQVYFFPCL